MYPETYTVAFNLAVRDEQLIMLSGVDINRAGISNN